MFNDLVAHIGHIIYAPVRKLLMVIEFTVSRTASIKKKLSKN